MEIIFSNESISLKTPENQLDGVFIEMGCHFGTPCKNLQYFKASVSFFFVQHIDGYDNVYTLQGNSFHIKKNSLRLKAIYNSIAQH